MQTSTPCFWHIVPGATVPTIIDLAIERDGRVVSQVHGKTIEELSQDYPCAQLGDLDTVIALKETALRSDPQEITEEHYLDALEVLPPLNWHRRGGFETFMCCEMTSGNMTAIYVQGLGKFWTFTDNATLTHEDIVAKVQGVKP